MKWNYLLAAVIAFAVAPAADAQRISDRDYLSNSRIDLTPASSIHETQLYHASGVHAGYEIAADRHHVQKRDHVQKGKGHSAKHCDRPRLCDHIRGWLDSHHHSKCAPYDCAPKGYVQKTVSQKSCAPKTYAQKSCAPKSYVQKTHAPKCYSQKGCAPKTYARKSCPPRSFVQKTHVPPCNSQKSCAPKSYVQKSHGRISHAQKVHAQKIHAQKGHTQKSCTQKRKGRCGISGRCHSWRDKVCCLFDGTKHHHGKLGKGAGHFTSKSQKAGAYTPADPLRIDAPPIVPSNELDPPPSIPSTDRPVILEQPGDYRNLSRPSFFGDRSANSELGRGRGISL